jgi:hypothetical protein
MELPGLTKALYGMTKEEAWQAGICIDCKKHATWYSPAGRAEYSISGLCEPCFDKITEEPEEEEMSKMESDLTSYDQNTDLELKKIEYDPNGMPNSQRAINVALSEGLTVRLPEANELLIDIDNEHSFMLFMKQIEIVKKYIGTKPRFNDGSYVVTESRHGLPGRHIVVTLDHDITETERLLLQACLGSDRVRELLGYVQMKNGDAHPTLFLEANPVGKLQKLLAVPKEPESKT